MGQSSLVRVSFPRGRGTPPCTGLTSSRVHRPTWSAHGGLWSRPPGIHRPLPTPSPDSSYPDARASISGGKIRGHLVTVAGVRSQGLGGRGQRDRIIWTRQGHGGGKQSTGPRGGGGAGASGIPGWHLTSKLGDGVKARQATSSISEAYPVHFW